MPIDINQFLEKFKTDCKKNEMADLSHKMADLLGFITFYVLNHVNFTSSMISDYQWMYF